MNYTFNGIAYQADLHRETTKEGGLVYRQHSIQLSSEDQDIEIRITGEEYDELLESPHFLVRSFIRERLNLGKFTTTIHATI